MGRANVLERQSFGAAVAKVTTGGAAACVTLCRRDPVMLPVTLACCGL